MLIVAIKRRIDCLVEIVEVLAAEDRNSAPDFRIWFEDYLENINPSRFGSGCKLSTGST